MSQIQSTERLEFVPGVEIVDVFVDFNLNCSNKPTLAIILEGVVTNSDFFPVSGDEDDTRWLTEVNGVFRGYRNSPPGASEDTKQLQSPTVIEHDQLGEVERYPDYHHVVANEQNERERASVMNVQVHTNTVTSYPVRVTRVQQIVDQYLNGPMGSDTISYWYWQRESGSGSWARSNTSRDDYKGYITPDSDIVLVYDSIYTWYPELESNVDDEITFSEGTFYGTVNDHFGSLWRLVTSEDEAIQEARRLESELQNTFSVEPITFS